MSDTLKDRIARASESLMRFMRRGTDYRNGDIVRSLTTGAYFTFRAYREDTDRTGLVEVQARPGGRLIVRLDRLELVRSAR